MESQDHLDIPTAINYLDVSLASFPDLKTRPNVALARLLLLQCGGDRDKVQSEMGNPSFLDLGDEDLDCRVTLLCALHSEEKAELVLGKYIASGKPRPVMKSEAYIMRARLRARQGRFVEARTDAGMSIQVIGNDQALKSKLQMDQIGLENEIPGYAAFIKAHPGK